MIGRFGYLLSIPSRRAKPAVAKLKSALLFTAPGSAPRRRVIARDKQKPVVGMFAHLVSPTVHEVEPEPAARTSGLFSAIKDLARADARRTGRQIHEATISPSPVDDSSRGRLCAAVKRLPGSQHRADNKRGSDVQTLADRLRTISNKRKGE